MKQKQKQEEQVILNTICGGETRRVEEGGECDIIVRGSVTH
jgi:hypothetical protein